MFNTFLEYAYVISWLQTCFFMQIWLVNIFKLVLSVIIIKHILQAALELGHSMSLTYFQPIFYFYTL